MVIIGCGTFLRFTVEVVSKLSTFESEQNMD